jgi:hypothetical protein
MISKTVLDRPRQTAAVLAHFKIESLVHDHKYRDAPKMGIAAKKKLSWWI